MKTEFKHTPGEWKILWGNYGTYCSINDEKNNNRIATIYSNIPVNGQDQHSGMAEEENGNAILIHAAPDLLNACIELLELLDEHEPEWYLKRHYNHAMKAIKKATFVKE